MIDALGLNPDHESRYQDKIKMEQIMNQMLDSALENKSKVPVKKGEEEHKDSFSFNQPNKSVNSEFMEIINDFKRKYEGISHPSLQ